VVKNLKYFVVKDEVCKKIKENLNFLNYGNIPTAYDKISNYKKKKN